MANRTETLNGTPRPLGTEVATMAGERDPVQHDDSVSATQARLLAVARADMDAVLAAGGVIATGLDGSLASGRVWPSSDVDYTVALDAGDDWGVEWRLRDGVLIHRHLSPWPFLERLRDGYPDSFVETASGAWFRDPTWCLDGLATLQPVWDPEGRLSTLHKFVRQRRFRPEVVEPRRPHLLAHARRWREEGAAAFASGDAPGGGQRLWIAMEALALIWLEADGRIISLKEADPELAAASAALGAPAVHRLFRAAGGVADLGPRLPDVIAAFQRLLAAWLQEMERQPPCPTVSDDSDRVLVHAAYARHRLHSAVEAARRGCWLHTAGVRADVERMVHVRPEDAPEPASTAPTPEQSLEVQEAAAQVLEAFPMPAAAERIQALQELEALTRQRFAAPEA